MLFKKYRCQFAIAIIVIVLPIVLFGRLNKTVGSIEAIQWKGDCVTLEDFKLIEIDSADCEGFPNISENMKASSRMKLINDSVIAYCENKEFNLLRIANLNTQEVIELLPVMVDGGRGLFSTISQIMWADDKIWIVDWRNYRIGALNSDYANRFDSMRLWTIPDGFHRIVPQEGEKFAYMPRFKEGIRVEMLNSNNNTSIISKKFPPVKRKGALNNLDVQGEMDVSPDMSYFVISTFGWDFIEIYNDRKVRMIRGPFFNETRHEPQDNMDSYIMANEMTSLSCLRVGKDKFSIGISDRKFVESANTIIPEIKTILVFSKDGQPLYRLSLPNVAYEYVIYYKNNELITLEDYFNPKLKKYKINTPLVINQ